METHAHRALPRKGRRKRKEGIRFNPLKNVGVREAARKVEKRRAS